MNDIKGIMRTFAMLENFKCTDNVTLSITIDDAVF